MSPHEIPADLRALHDQAVECEAQGLTYLAAALRNMLHRQMQERGLSAPDCGAAGTFPELSVKTPGNPVYAPAPALPERLSQP